MHNHSAFVYESLEVLDINNSMYLSLIGYAKKAAANLGIEFGAAHLEIMLTPRGPVLIELGARLHGGIAPLVFEKCYTPDLLQSMGDLLTGNFISTPAKLKRKARIIFLINELDDFMIKDIQALLADISAVNTVDYVKLFFKSREKIPLTTNLLNCPGIVSLIGDTDAELNQAEKQVRHIFQNK